MIQIVIKHKKYHLVIKIFLIYKNKKNVVFCTKYNKIVWIEVKLNQLYKINNWKSNKFTYNKKIFHKFKNKMNKIFNNCKNNKISDRFNIKIMKNNKILKNLKFN